MRSADKYCTSERLLAHCACRNAKRHTPLFVLDKAGIERCGRESQDASPMTINIPAVIPSAGAARAEGSGLLSMELIACVPKDLVDLLPAFLPHRQAEVIRLRAALAARDWARIRDVAERMLALGNPYGFRQITTFGRLMRKAGAEQNELALIDLIGAYADYLSKVAVIEVDVPALAKAIKEDAAEARNGNA
jgi:hypothetical protein